MVYCSLLTPAAYPAETDPSFKEPSRDYPSGLGIDPRALLPNKLSRASNGLLDPAVSCSNVQLK